MISWILCNITNNRFMPKRILTADALKKARWRNNHFFHNLSRGFSLLHSFIKQMQNQKPVLLLEMYELTRTEHRFFACLSFRQDCFTVSPNYAIPIYFRKFYDLAPYCIKNLSMDRLDVHYIFRLMIISLTNA